MMDPTTVMLFFFAISLNAAVNGPPRGSPPPGGISGDHPVMNCSGKQMSDAPAAAASSAIRAAASGSPRPPATWASAIVVIAGTGLPWSCRRG